MSCKHRRESLLLIVVTVCLHTVSSSLSLGDGSVDRTKETITNRWNRIKRNNRGIWRVDEKVVSNLRRATDPDLKERRPEAAVLSGGTLPPASEQNPGENRLPWTTGHIIRTPRSSAPDSQDGYQADSSGSTGVRGKVLAPSFDHSPHFPDWQAMRPVVQCDDDVMTFTASGDAFTQLLVEREGASPISPLLIPSHCGFSVRMSWSDLKMMVPYDACYITQENGSYVLPMLWWGSPLKLSCPVQMAKPSLSAPPSVLCSYYGMAVQIDEQDVATLGVMVNGGRGPFVSEYCAQRIYSHPGKLAFIISLSAPCITREDGYHLRFVLGDEEYILSCPVNLPFPYAPPPPPTSPPPSPINPHFPNIPEPVTTVPTTPPRPPTTEATAQPSEYLNYRYPGYRNSQLPQVDPPGPQPAHPPQPSHGRPPGPQPQQLRPLYPMWPGTQHYSPGDELKYPSPPYQLPVMPPPPYQLPVMPPPPSLPNPKDGSFHEVSKLPVDPSHYSSGVYYPYVFYYPAVTPAPTSAATTTTTTSAAPATQLPRPPSPPASQPKPPPGPQLPLNPMYLPAYYSSYYNYGQFAYPQPGLEVQPASTSHATVAPPLPTTAITTTMTTPMSKTPSPAVEKPHTTLEPLETVPAQTTCAHYAHAIGGYHPHPYYPYPFNPLYPPHYHQPAPPTPENPQTPPPTTTKEPLTTPTSTAPTPSLSTTTSTASTPAEPTPQTPVLQCRMGRMVAFLPSAHPDSIQVRDEMTWRFLSSVSPSCGYMLQMAENSGIFFHAPLPACHSVSQSTTTVSFPLRFWDISLEKYRTLDLQCPLESTTESPVLVTPTVLPTPPSTTKVKVSPPVVPMPKVFCSSHQMTVELPSGPLSGVVVKDNKGNQMNFQDTPKHCGYFARKGKDGKIHLSLQLHSRCHMSVQGKIYVITVIYMTLSGRRESQFSCPILVPGSGQECNLPSGKRLPCGPTSVSQPRCLSLGCCFNKHPLACFYPMDECTIDRHFVFSVPASLTDPPLSPDLLMAAGNSTCKPERVTSDYALFKIPMDGCGTRRVMVGKTVIYIVEIINKVQALSLNYGTITRDSPVRLLVECRYLPDTVLSVSYMVKTPTLGPAVHTQGVFGVQLRIAKDAQYGSYFPQYHQPLQMLLGKPLYLEVRLINNPDPSLVLLVHFCVAYPRSGTSVWLLLYNGCPNPLDPAPQQAVVFDPLPPSPQAQTRRFTISTFQFLPDGEFKDPDEEIYFMCSTEICSPGDGPCIEGCFGE